MMNISDILNNPPPGIDLTLVGGQALVYWTLIYREKYPQLFPDEIISSTYDLDFIVRFKEACEICAAHWGGQLNVPGLDDHTPEAGVIVIDTDDESEPLRIDLLNDLLRFEKADILKNRIPIAQGQEAFKDMYVLSEFGVLLNRVYNTVSLSRYRSPEAIRQLRNGLAIHHAYVLWCLDQGEIKMAQKQCNTLLRLAKSSTYGMPLMLDYSVDLLEAVPLEDDRYEPVFVDNGLQPLISQVESKRDRLVRSRLSRRSTQPKP